MLAILAAALSLTGPVPATIDVHALGTPSFASSLQERICDDQTDKTCPQAVPHWRPVLGSGGALSADNRSGGSDTVYTDPTFRGVVNGALGTRTMVELNPLTVKPTYLAITAHPTPAADKAAVFGKPWTSGLLSSKFLYTFTYGYAEVSANLPTCDPALWPAIWLTAVKGPWPTGGEIDMVEGVQSRLYFTVHRPGGAPSASVPATCARGWHRYGALKTPSTVAFYLDGAKVFETPATPDMAQPMQLIVNLAVGGSWATNGGKIAPTLAPKTAYFSSARVWEIKP